MKKGLVIVLLGLILTGCATRGINGEPSFGSQILCGYGLCSPEVSKWNNDQLFNKARQDCYKAGLTENNPQFSQCVQNMVISARNQRAIENAGRSAGNSNSNNTYHPKTISCRQVGSFVNCTEF